jgi:hypothetical protein
MHYLPESRMIFGGGVHEKQNIDTHCILISIVKHDFDDADPEDSYELPIS